MPRYDFTCELGCGTHEEVRGYEVEETDCPKCGGPARREAVYPSQSICGDTVPKGNATRAGNIKDRNGRTRVSLFTEASEEMNYAHTKAENEQGRKLASPNLYKAGLERARQMGAQIRGTT
jgi:hypothetical protein